MREARVCCCTHVDFQLLANLQVTSTIENTALLTGMGTLMEATVYDEHKRVVLSPASVYHVVLGTWHGDLQMQVKLMRRAGINHILHCCYCMSTSTLPEGETTRRSMGYASAARVDGGLCMFREDMPQQQNQFVLTVDGDLHFRSGNDGMQVRAYTAQHHLIHSKAADHKRVVDTYGMHGMCVTFRLLPYTRFDATFLIPIYHTFFRGIFRDFMIALIGRCDKGEAKLPQEYRLTTEQAQQLKFRCQRMHDPQCISRPLRKDIAEQVKNCTIEELCRLLDVHLPLLFAEVGSVRMSGRVDLRRAFDILPHVGGI